MFDFKIAAADPATMYRDLASALEGLVHGETDAIANMANAAALIWETLPGLNWAGFACDSASASELVVPIVRGDELIAVLDLDAPVTGRFSEADEAGCIRLAEILATAL
jgi:GAF domain-containing protein